MAKKLVINCAGCDIRKAQQENYKQYESIIINAATVLTNTSGKAFLSALPITLNCANMLEIEDDAVLKSINGSCEIKSVDRIPDSKFMLQVNGSLTIGPNTEKYLQQCVGIVVNGSVRYPESMAPYLGGMDVNGPTYCYPDEAIVLKRNHVVDHLFALRAKSSLYWSPKRMILVDPDLDPQKLREKGCSFSSKEVIISKSHVEAMADLIDEKTDMIIVPDGTAVVLDDLTLNARAFQKYGNKLYILGDVEVPMEDDCLDGLQYLVVKGDARVPQERKEKFMDVLTDMDGELETLKPKGSQITDRLYLKVTKWMLDQHPAGLDIRDCQVVKICQELTKQMILEQLHIENCSIVKCSEDLEDAVSMVCEDVGFIDIQKNDDNAGIGDTVQTVLSGLGGNADTKVINTADYVL